MEIQSGNGEEVASAVSATSGFVSRSPSGPQVEVSDDPVLREDLQAAKRIERFDIPLDSLKRMFEKPAVAATVSSAFSFFVSVSCAMKLNYSQVDWMFSNCQAPHIYLSDKWAGSLKIAVLQIEKLLQPLKKLKM